MTTEIGTTKTTAPVTRSFGQYNHEMAKKVLSCGRGLADFSLERANGKGWECYSSQRQISTKMAAHKMGKYASVNGTDGEIQDFEVTVGNDRISAVLQYIPCGQREARVRVDVAMREENYSRALEILES